MAKIPDRLSLVDIIRRPALLRDVLRFNNQIRNLEVIDGSGVTRRIKTTPKSLNAILDLRLSEVTVTSTPPPIVISNPWSEAAVSNGGCVTDTAIQIAEATHRAITAATFANKIVMFWPFLGCNIISARVPLINRLGKAISTNTGLTDANFAQQLGIQGGSGYFDSLVLPSELGAGNAGGLGWWETNIAGGLTGEVEPIGSYLNSNIPDNRFSIDLRPASRTFRWGPAAGVAGEGIAPVNGHYYGQSPNAGSRSFYLDGVRKTTVVGNVALSSDRTMLLMGCDTGVSGKRPWSGRGFLAYMTDGSLTDDEVATFHALLLKYLVNPKLTGVPVPFGSTPGGGEFPDPTDPENEEDDDHETVINSILVDDITGAVLTDDVTHNVLTNA